MQSLRLILDLLPQTSLFRSGEPYYLIAIPFLASIPTTMVVLYLACRSIGLQIPLLRCLWPSAVIGLGSCLIRQIVPLPFHIIPNLLMLIICTMILGKVGASRALLGGVFAVSVTIMGSFLTIEPLLIVFRNFSFLNRSLGYTLGSLAETIIPLIVLVLFDRFNITLVPHGGNAADSHG